MKRILGYTLSILFLVLSGCGETEYERNYHTHWHKHTVDDWAYHADEHSHPIEETSVWAHKERFGKDGKIIADGHDWFYHGYIENYQDYQKYLIWAENNLR